MDTVVKLRNGSKLRVPVNIGSEALKSLRYSSVRSLKVDIRKRKAWSEYYEVSKNQAYSEFSNCCVEIKFSRRKTMGGLK